MNAVHRPDSYEVGDYTGVLRRRWLIVILLTCVGIAGALAYVVVSHKVYTSTAEVEVVPTLADQGSNPQGGRTSGSVNMDSQAQYVISITNAEAAAKIMHTSLKPYALKKNVSAAVPPNTTDMNISCKQPSGNAAAACAQAFASAYLQYRSAQAKSVLNSQLNTVNADISTLQHKIAALQATINASPPNSSQAQDAKVQYTSDQSQLNTLDGKLAGLQAQAGNTTGASLLSPALVPGSPSSPKKSLVLPSGLVAGLVLGLIAAFAWDRRDKRIHVPADIERFFDMPTLLGLPRQAVGRQIALASPRSRTGRAFTEMAYTVAASLGEGSHVVLVTGTRPGPAASMVAANLAATLARTHSDVVLVCADMRDSVAPRLFGLEGSRGLAEVIAGRATVSEVARGPRTLPGLWVIPPGADASLGDGQLQYDTAKALTSQLRRDARYVIIEAQITEDGADTLALAEFADAAVLTVETERTTREQVSACVQRLHRVRTPLLGAAVLAAVPSRISVRPPQPTSGRIGSAPPARDLANGKKGRNGSAEIRGDISPVSASWPGFTEQRQLIHPASAGEDYGDPAGRTSGS